MSGSTADASFYIQIEPEWSYNGQDIRSARVVRYTQGKPQKPASGTVLVKLTVRLPTAVFKPLQPEAIVVIPATFTELAPIEVEANDPRDPQEDQE